MTTATDTPARAANKALAVDTLDDLKRLASICYASGLAEGATNAEAVLMIMAAGMEMGLSPAAAVRALQIRKNKITMPGAAAVGFIRQSPVCEWFRMGTAGEADEMVGWCEAKRGGDAEPVRREFSAADAKRAGLWGKKTEKGYDTPWTLYPARMVMWRAVGFVVSDVFSDVLLGFYLSENMDPEPAAPVRDGRTRTEALLDKSRTPAMCTRCGTNPRLPGWNLCSGCTSAETPPPIAAAPPPAGATEGDGSPGEPAGDEPPRSGAASGPAADPDRPASWGEFMDRVTALFADAGLPPKKAAAAVNVALGRDRLLIIPRGDVPAAWRDAFIADVRAGKIDLKTGKATEPAPAEQPAPPDDEPVGTADVLDGDA